MDITLRWTLRDGPEGVCLGESWLYAISIDATSFWWLLWFSWWICWWRGRFGDSNKQRGGWRAWENCRTSEHWKRQLYYFSFVRGECSWIELDKETLPALLCKEGAPGTVPWTWKKEPKCPWPWIWGKSSISSQVHVVSALGEEMVGGGVLSQ